MFKSVSRQSLPSQAGSSHTVIDHLEIVLHLRTFNHVRGVKVNPLAAKHIRYPLWLCELESISTSG